MALKIEQDYGRYKEIVRGKLRKELRKYISNGEMIGRIGKKYVSIPIPTIDLPHFAYGPNQSGVGQGEGKEGEALGDGEESGGDKAGNSPGFHIEEVEVSLEELAQLLGEELELPKIEPKGSANVLASSNRYSSMRRSGPNSLLHFKRTYKEALKRQIISGAYDPDNPIIVPVKEDKRFRSFKSSELPQRKAVVIYMMDVSGSMGSEQKEIVRTEAFWIDTWLKHNYHGIETRYIIHDAVAREVDYDTFFRTRESGGTIISSAYKLCLQLINEKYDPMEWNIYPFHFSDGDNWSSEDTNECMNLLESDIFPCCNMFCYGQVESEYGSGQFIKDLHERFGSEHEKMITSKIDNKEMILTSIKEFLGKGK